MKTKTKVGLNSIIEVEFSKREDSGHDFNLSIFQLVDSAFVTSHKFNCVTREELLELSENIKKLVLGND